MHVEHGPGELLLAWSIRLAVACYVARLLIDARGDRSRAAEVIGTGILSILPERGLTWRQLVVIFGDRM